MWQYIKHIFWLDNKDGPIFKVGHYVRISKYKNIFAKGYVPIWSEGAFVIYKVKNTVLWTNVISDLNGDKIVRKFYEQELPRTNKKNV